MMMLYIGSKNEIVAVDLEKVAYVKAEGYFSRFCYASGRTIIVSMSIGKLCRLLDAPNFVRVGRSLIVNLNVISHVNVLTGALEFSDETGCATRINLSKRMIRTVANLLSRSVKVIPISEDTPSGY